MITKRYTQFIIFTSTRKRYISGKVSHYIGNVYPFNNIIFYWKKDLCLAYPFHSVLWWGACYCIEAFNTNIKQVNTFKTHLSNIILNMFNWFPF